MRQNIKSRLIMLIVFLIPTFVYGETTEKVAKEINSQYGINYGLRSRVSSDGNYVISQTYDVEFAKSLLQDVTCHANNNYCSGSTIVGYDRSSKSYEMISKTNSGDIAFGSNYPNMSGNGKYVVYESAARNLDRDFQLEGRWSSDIYLHDRDLGVTEIVSVNSNQEIAEQWSEYQGARSDGPSVTDDGRLVAFTSNAKNFPYAVDFNFRNVYVRDRVKKTTEIVSIGWDGSPANAYSFYSQISPDGNFVVFVSEATNLIEGGTLGGRHVFIRDLNTGETRLINVQTDYYVSPEISSDSKFVVFKSSGSKICVYEYLTGSHELINVSMGFRASISNEGRFVAFSSKYNPLTGTIGSIEDVYVYDRIKNLFKIISLSSEGYQGDNDSYAPEISGNGRIVVFSSLATNLVPDDLTGRVDAFARDQASDFDGDGFVVFEGIVNEDCDDNDFNVNPLAEEIPYNQFDENCNGMLDDDDLDLDGYGIALDCNDEDKNINPSILEVAYNGIDENCNGMEDDDDLDQDGFGIALDCNDDDSVVNPDATETPYNGVDENCNGMADDTDFDGDGYDYTVDCNDNDASIYPGAPETKHDGIDQDCNGYDLTIDITVADYNIKDSLLTVKATSSWGASANLEVLGYGPMTWKDNQQVWQFDLTCANPGTVTVTGFEGAETATVTVQ